MARTKDQKKKILKNLTDKISQAKSIVFVRFNKLGVKENRELRKKLKAENSEYYVAKKTLLDLAFKNQPTAGLEIKKFDGQIATIFGFGDEITPAKIVDNFKKEQEDKIEFVGGIFENKLISSSELSKLAKLPSRLELCAKIVGSINAPVSGFVNALSGNLRNLVYVLKAVGEKK